MFIALCFILAALHFTKCSLASVQFSATTAAPPAAYLKEAVGCCARSSIYWKRAHSYQKQTVIQPFAIPGLITQWTVCHFSPVSKQINITASVIEKCKLSYVFILELLHKYDLQFVEYVRFYVVNFKFL